MTKTHLPLNDILEKYHGHLVVYGQKKFPIAKAKLLEIIMMVLVMSGVGATLWVLEMLHQMDVRQGKVIFLIAFLSVGIIIYTYTVIMMGVKRYRMAYRAVQAFTDPRKPVVYLRAFHADDVVETQEKPHTSDKRMLFGERLMPFAMLFTEEGMLFAAGRFHKWLTGSPNPMTRYSLEEVIAPYFRRLGPFFSIGRPTRFFVPMIGSTRIYVEDNYWQNVVLDLLKIASFVVIRVDISSGLSWEIEQAFRNMSTERIVLLLADNYGNPYAWEQCATVLSMLPQDVCVKLLGVMLMPPNTLRNVWYVYFNPEAIPCTISRENGISDIGRATAVLLREISGCQGILPTKDNLAPDYDEDILVMVASIIAIVGVLVVVLEALRITLVVLLDVLGIT